MNQITPYQLWIGHAKDGCSFEKLFDEGIQVIVQLAIEEPPLEPPRELVYLRFPLIDGNGNKPEVLDLAIATMAKLVRQRTPTIVCCGAGMSRSPAIVATALSLVESVVIEKCLERVIQMHSADVSTTLWEEICDLLNDPGMH